MKKSLLMMGAAIAVLSSCTQNEVLDIADANTIKFGNTHIGKPTRAASVIDNTTFNSFYVYGQKEKQPGNTWEPIAKLQNANVYKGDGTSWGYDDLVDYESGKYAFAAYSDGGILGKGSGKLESGATFTPKGTPSPANSTLTINDYQATSNNDFVVSISTTDLSSANAPVEFTFKHALSQIKFTIQSALGDKNKILIENFEVEGFKDKATLTYTEGLNTELGQKDIVWTAPNDTRKLQGLDDNHNIATTSKSAYGTYVVIPQTVSQSLSVKFKATMYDESGQPVAGKSKDMTATISGLPVFEPGFSYNFIATIDGEDMDVISFNPPTVGDWIPANDINF